MRILFYSEWASIVDVTKAFRSKGNLQHKVGTWDPFLMKEAEVRKANLLRREKECS